MKKMRKAFTLIEVLLAVVILSVSGLALLQSAANNTKSIHYMLSKKKFMHLFSIFALNMDETLHNTSKSFEDLLDKKYTLDDDTRRFLKEKRYELRSEAFDKMLLEDPRVSSQSVTFIVQKNSINGDFGAYMYTLKNED